MPGREEVIGFRVIGVVDVVFVVPPPPPPPITARIATSALNRNAAIVDAAVGPFRMYPATSLDRDFGVRTGIRRFRRRVVPAPTSSPPSAVVVVDDEGAYNPPPPLGPLDQSVPFETDASSSSSPSSSPSSSSSKSTTIPSSSLVAPPQGPS